MSFGRRFALLSALFVAFSARLEGQVRAGDSPVVPGDRFVLRFFGDTTSRAIAAVDERMVADLPLTGPISLRGFSAHTALDSVRARLLTYRREGGFNVTFERRIAVLGDVRRPDLYYMDLSVRLRAALAMAGGVSEAGQTREIVLLRDGVQTRIFNWRTTEAGEMELRSGDELVVPRERWIKRNALTVVSATGVVASIIVAFVLR
jgi:protein involved in polysaccharide export with SLBB domain